MVQRVAASVLQRHRRTDGRINWPSVMGEPLLVPMLVVLAVVWLLPHNPYPTRLTTALTSNLLAYTPTIPSVHIDTHPSLSFQSRYPANKTALYIEPRADIPYMIPLLLHMMLVVPPDWRFVFFGSAATVERVRGSYTAAMYEGLGKLHVRDLAETAWGEEWGRDGWEEGGGLATEEIQSRLLTNSSFYERELRGAEWLLVWHSDAILCANAEVGLDEWLGWDWVGAPWTDGRRYGGNGGLSIRKVSKVMEILEFQKRLDNTAPEDLWMSSRLETIPNAKMCPPDKAREFAVADIWHEWPLGFHINPGGLSENVWRPLERRKQIFEYCPELKIIMDMALDREKCPEQVEAERQESALFQQNQEQKDQEVDKPKTAEEEEEERKKQLEEESRARQRQKDEAIRAKKQKEKEIYEAAMKKHKSEKDAGMTKTKAAAATGRVRKPEHFDINEEPESGRVAYGHGDSGKHDHDQAEGSDFLKHDHASDASKDEKTEDDKNDSDFQNDSHASGDSKEKTEDDKNDSDFQNDSHASGDSKEKTEDDKNDSGFHEDSYPSSDSSEEKNGDSKEKSYFTNGEPEAADSSNDGSEKAAVGDNDGYHTGDGYGEHSDDKADTGEDKAGHADDGEHSGQADFAKGEDHDAKDLDVEEKKGQDGVVDEPILDSYSESNSKSAEDDKDEFASGDKSEDEQRADEYGGLALDFSRMGKDEAE